MRSRVIPGSLVTMARRVLERRLKRVDLPTLGRPTMTRDGRGSGMCGSHCSVPERGKSKVEGAGRGWEQAAREKCRFARVGRGGEFSTGAPLPGFLQR